MMPASFDPEYLVPFYGGVAVGLLVAAGVVAAILAVCLWRISWSRGGRPGARDE